MAPHVLRDTNTRMAYLQVDSISKSYGNTTVLDDISFHVDEGEIVCLLGPSGCGKTTLLRIITGLERADAGHLAFDDHPLDDVPVHRRGFGLMFQDYALFPHKNVEDNVSFGLRIQGLSGHQLEGRVAAMLALVGLEGYRRRQVYDLSGGEQQRVALARSLAPGPRLLMLDEPLGSLDRALREELMNELRAILKRVEVTTIYVTHDQEEAFAVADRVMIMNQGRIVQKGSPQSVYCQPASSWVAQFLGLTNLLPGRVVSLQPPQVDTALGILPLTTEEQLAVGQTVTVLIRPEAARFGTEPDSIGETPWFVEGTVHECSFRGGTCRLVIQHPAGIELDFQLLSDAAQLPQPGMGITLALRPEAITLLAERP
jgi:ABC-type Fe3+/spermidine/putrescine transport system ATPase subunit